MKWEICENYDYATKPLPHLEDKGINILVHAAIHNQVKYTLLSGTCQYAKLRLEYSIGNIWNEQ